MTVLWLARHGQTDWNASGRWQGQSEVPLNAQGRAQAAALAARLNGTPFEAVYSSDLQRARVTAEIIAQRLGLPLRCDGRLREINHGQWEGLLGSEIPARFPVEWQARERDPLHTPSPGGESPVQVAARVWAAADDIARAHPAGPVLIISHGFALATLLCRARGLPLEIAPELIPANARVEVIAWEPQL